MKPALFDFHAPTGLREAVTLLEQGGADARVLGGGQSLVPMMNFRIASPTVLVDLRGISELDALVVDDDGVLVIGANVTQARLLDSDQVAGWPLLRDALRHVGHPQIRNRGTVCGSLAHHDPAAELPTVAVTLDAEVILSGPNGNRVVPAREFFVSYYETSIRTHEIVTSVRFPPRATEGWGFAEFARKHGDFALAGAAATMSDADVRLVLFGVDESPRRVPEVEQLLRVGSRDDTAIDAALDGLPDLIQPVDDMRATAQFRAEVAVEMSRVALRSARDGSHD